MYVIKSFNNLRRPFKKPRLLRGAPRPSTAKQINLEQLAERSFIILRQEADLQGEPIPDGGAYKLVEDFKPRRHYSYMTLSLFYKYIASSKE